MRQLQLNVTIVLLTALLVRAQDVPGAARNALQSGDYARAEQIYRSLLAGSPKSAELLHNLAVALYFQGKSSEATVFFERAMDIKPLTATLAFLAANYCRLDQADRATRLLRKLINEKPGPELLNVAASCYLQAGDPLEAIIAFSVLQHSREHANDRTAVGLARAYFQASKYFLDLLEKLPGDKESYLHAIEKARSQSTPDARGAEAEALKNASYIGSQPTFERLAELWPRHPKDPALAYLLGVECGDLAMKAYLQCEKDYAESLALAQLQAEMLARQGQYSEAVAHLRQLVAQIPESADLHRDLGLTYYRMGHYADALVEFEQQSRLQPQSEEPEVAISKCLLQLGRLNDAVARLKPVVERDHTPDWALLDWATVQQDLGHLDQAIAALKGLEQRDTSNATVHYRLAQLYDRVGNKAEAAREFAVFSRLRAK